MKTGPLNESELEWLDDILTKYNTAPAILEGAGGGGLFTAGVGFPRGINPEKRGVGRGGGAWYVAGGGGGEERGRY
ncbi:YecA family protein, partial [Escherichia coli]|nr:YecA family protein [Escherichia coli]